MGHQARGPSPGLLGRVAFPAELLMHVVIEASLCSLRCFRFERKTFPGELQWFGFQSCFVCGLWAAGLREKLLMFCNFFKWAEVHFKVKKSVVVELSELSLF